MEEKTLNYFSLNKQVINEAYICSVYDGDTITAVFPFPGTTMNYKWKCRLSGIDTPEIRTKCMEEKCKAKEVRDILRAKILNKNVRLECGPMDKYGRILVDVIINNENVNKWLIENNYAYEYYGKTKKKFKNS